MSVRNIDGLQLLDKNKALYFYYFMLSNSQAKSEMLKLFGYLISYIITLIYIYIYIKSTLTLMSMSNVLI